MFLNNLLEVSEQTTDIVTYIAIGVVGVLAIIVAAVCIGNRNAKKFDTLSYMDVLNKNLGVMDMTAASFCKDRNIPFLVFSIEDPENIVRAVSGEKVGTLVQ